MKSLQKNSSLLGSELKEILLVSKEFKIHAYTVYEVKLFSKKSSSNCRQCTAFLEKSQNLYLGI